MRRVAPVQARGGRRIYAPVDLSQSNSSQMRRWWSLKADRNRSTQMMDVLMLALTFGWFALAIGYAYACERL